MNRIFNKARMAYQGQILSGKEMAIILSDMPYSNNGAFLATLVKHHALNKVNKDQYMFTANPVHYTILEKAINELRVRQRAYNKKYHDKKRIAKSEEKSDIQKAIDLLLSTGEYEIFKIEKIVTVKKIQL